MGTSLKVCDGSGKSQWCATKQPHRHCECGLPMRVGAFHCRLCVEDRILSWRRFDRDRADGLLAARSFHNPDSAGFKGTEKRVRVRRKQEVAS